MGRPEIGTILSEEKDGLKYFIIYDRNGRPVWATEGYKEAVLIKADTNWFVIKGDGQYLGFSCDYKTNDGLYNFEETYYRNLMDLDEISEYENMNNPQTPKQSTSDLELLNRKTTSVSEIAKSVEDFKNEVFEQTQELQEEMDKTLTASKQNLRRLIFKKAMEIYHSKARETVEENENYAIQIKQLKKELKELKDRYAFGVSWDEKRDETTQNLILKKNGIIEDLKKSLKTKDKTIQILTISNIVLLICTIIFCLKMF